MAIDVDSGLLWLGYGRGVRDVGSGDFARFVAFLPLEGASATFRIVLLGNINRPLSGCPYNGRVHISIKSLS